MCMDYLDQIRPWGGSANRITHLIPCHPIKHASPTLSQLYFDADFVNIANFLWRSPKHDQVSCDNIIPDVFSLRPWDSHWPVSRLYSDGRIRLGKGQYCVSCPTTGRWWCFILFYYSCTQNYSWDVFFNFLWLQFSAGVWYVTEKFGTKGTCLTYQFKTDNLGFKSVEQVKSAAVMNFVMILTKTLCLDQSDCLHKPARDRQPLCVSKNEF